MRNSALIAGLVAVLSAGAVAAQPVPAGIAQLAAQAGVNAADYSTSEIVGLWSAVRDNDAAAPYSADLAAVNADVSRGSASLSVGTEAGVSAGKAQLAAQLGVNPADYSFAQLISLKNARSDD